MKASFSLLITLLLLALFAYLGTFILQTQTLSSHNLTHSYLATQAKQHSQFIKEYMKKSSLKNCPNQLNLEVDNFSIEVRLQYKEPCETHSTNEVIIHTFVKDKIDHYNVSTHETFKRLLQNYL